MLDHGQLGPPTPAFAFSPASSRRPSVTDAKSDSRRPSFTQPRSRLGSTSDTRARRPSLLSFGGHTDSLSMSALDTEDDPEDQEEASMPSKQVSLGVEAQSAKIRPAPGSGSDAQPRRPSRNGQGLSESLSMSALETDDDPDDEIRGEATGTSRQTSIALDSDDAHVSRTSHDPIQAASLLGRRLSDAVIASPADTTDNPSPEGDSVSTSRMSPTVPEPAPAISTHAQLPNSLANPSDLAAQLYANPKLAALRSSANMAPMQPTGKAASPPILVNPKCSGYFVEPVRLRDP